MKLKISILIIIASFILMGFSIFKKQTKEEKFWNWVLKNKTNLEKFINSDLEDYTIYNELNKQIKEYNSILYAEMTLTKKNEVVLIITPDGIPEGVLPTQKLYNSKPNLKNWIVKKFRQPLDEVKLNFRGLEYDSSDIIIVPEFDTERNKINIKIFITNMNLDIDRYQSLAFLYLDHILGEYNTITKIGYIDFFHLDKNKKIDDGISILELRRLIDLKLNRE
ncbi:MAG: hypothetical protein L6Q46_10325 [Flavobacterium sp.]|uniref:hypothetical protein n=1 Tax=Flavobacterium sp. TaxID=239 RepID=UPI0025B96892|nr:hypothetical protein [Flavobacterium sp.]MCK6608676.1 hypothetical protein [Flavobacterium sp.]